MISNPPLIHYSAKIYLPDLLLDLLEEDLLEDREEDLLDLAEDDLSDLDGLDIELLEFDDLLDLTRELSLLDLDRLSYFLDDCSEDLEGRS